MTRTSILQIRLKRHKTKPHDDRGNKCGHQQL